MGGAKAHYDGIGAFSQTDFTEDLKKITVPVLVMHDDDQIVPYADFGPAVRSAVQNGTLKTYKGFPHGMPTTQAETINADLLAFSAVLTDTSAGRRLWLCTLCTRTLRGPIRGLNIHTCRGSRDAIGDDRVITLSAS
jgi:hypothetical protein